MSRQPEAGPVDIGLTLVDAVLVANTENDRMCNSKIELVRASTVVLAVAALGCIPIVALRP
jgi:hypothetical protein